MGRVVRVVDDNAATGDPRDGPIDIGHIAGVLAYVVEERRRRAARDQPRYMPVARNCMFQANDIVRVDVLPATERLLSHAAPERTVPKVGTTTTKVVFLGPSLPQIDETSNWDEIGQLAEQQREDGTARAAIAPDVGDIERWGRFVGLETVSGYFRGENFWSFRLLPC